MRKKTYCEFLFEEHNRCQNNGEFSFVSFKQYEELTYLLGFVWFRGPYDELERNLDRMYLLYENPLMIDFLTRSCELGVEGLVPIKNLFVDAQNAVRVVGPELAKQWIRSEKNQVGGGMAREKFITLLDESFWLQTSEELHKKFRIETMFN